MRYHGMRVASRRRGGNGNPASDEQPHGKMWNDDGHKSNSLR